MLIQLIAIQDEAVAFWGDAVGLHYISVQAAAELCPVREPCALQSGTKFPPTALRGFPSCAQRLLLPFHPYSYHPALGL